MSDTPRTDAAPKAAYRDAMFCELVSADFARELERELSEVNAWKVAQLSVNAWWDEIDNFVREHKDAVIGQSVSQMALRWLKERDDAKEDSARLRARLSEIGDVYKYPGDWDTAGMGGPPPIDAYEKINLTEL